MTFLRSSFEKKMKIHQLVPLLMLESIYFSDLKHNDLMKIIKEHGKNLYSINLWIDCLGNYCNYPLTLQRLHLNFVLECISAGCPKLKSLTLGSNMWNLQINRENLEELHNSCKELKDLKLSNISFKDILTENDITELFPNCDVEVSECEYETMDEVDSDSDWTDETMDEDDSDSDWTADDSPDSDE